MRNTLLAFLSFILVTTLAYTEESGESLSVALPRYECLNKLNSNEVVLAQLTFNMSGLTSGIKVFTTFTKKEYCEKYIESETFDATPDLTNKLVHYSKECFTLSGIAFDGTTYNVTHFVAVLRDPATGLVNSMYPINEYYYKLESCPTE